MFRFFPPSHSMPAVQCLCPTYYLFFLIVNKLDMYMSPHHLPCRCQPFSSLHNTKGAVPEFFKQRQVLLWDEAGQSLLLLPPIERTTTTGLCGQDFLPEAQRRRRRQLTKWRGWLSLLGEVTIWTLTTKHLVKCRREGQWSEESKLCYTADTKHWLQAQVRDHTISTIT